MKEDCECVKRLREIAETRLQEARKLLERDLPRRLEVFTEAMREGSVQLVARRLLRAGAYRATLDKGSGGQVDPQAALAAIPRVVAGRPALQEFFKNEENVLYEQMKMIDPQDFRVTVRRRRRFREALGGHIDTELDAAERLLRQLEQLEKRLPSWKSYVRGAEAPRLELVADMHESSATHP